jgi:hypothetical protein
MCLLVKRVKRTHFLPKTSGRLAKNSANPPVSRPGNEAKPKGLTLTEKSRQKTASRLRGTLRPEPFLCFSERFLPQRQSIDGSAVFDLLYLFAQPKLVEVLIQEQEPIAPFAWCGSSVTDPVQQFARHRLHLRVGIGFRLESTHAKSRQAACVQWPQSASRCQCVHSAAQTEPSSEDDVRPPPRLPQP